MKIKGLYQKRGWYYFQPPMLDGERPKPVALRTQDHGAAVREAFRIHQKGAVDKAAPMKMSVGVGKYLRAKKSERAHTLTTSEITRRVLDKLTKDWGDPFIASITTKKITEWRGALAESPGIGGAEKMSDASIHSYLLRMRGFLRWAEEQNIIPKHPMDGMKFGRVKKTRREKFCAIEERELLLANPPSPEIDLILHFGFFAGLRFGEMIAMRHDWLEKGPNGWILTVKETREWKPKDKEVRSLALHARIVEAVGRCCPAVTTPEQYVIAPLKKVWPDPPAYRYNPKKSFRSHCKASGCEFVTYHTLRHSFATHMAGNGASMVQIAAALGDSLRVTEQNYIGYSPFGKSAIHDL